jgi:hypothetical protein
MNKHISLVKRYLAGEDVTAEELRANSTAAYAAAHAAASTAAHVAASTAAYADAAYAAADYYVKRYEELSNK